MSSFIAMSVVIFIISSLFYGIFNENVKPIRFKDKLDIGYISEPVRPIEPITIIIKEKKNVDKQKPKTTIASSTRSHSVDIPNPPDSKLLIDCIDFLALMGIPKRKAKAEAEIIFERNSNIKTAQDFINIYTRK